MHKKKIVHRDLKPENILISGSEEDQQLEVKVVDFGFASFYDPKVGLDRGLGSPLYMAPEIIQKKTYTEKVDIWSIGVIAYILLTGRVPFGGSSKDEIKA